MKVNSVNSTTKSATSSTANSKSFKGIYTLKGQPDILDEICWYMSKVQKKPEKNFDFLDIRSTQSIKPKEDGFTLFFDGNNTLSFMSPEPTRKRFLLDDNSCFDLFITGEDKKLADPIMRNMVEDSVGRTKNNVTMAEKVKILLTNLSEMDDKICKRKPVSNVDFLVLKSYMGKIFDLSKLREMKAEDAYQGLQKGTFDMTEGLIKQN